MCLSQALVERKKELEAKQKELDLERKKTIELEDALKSRGVPREVSETMCVYMHEKMCLEF